VPILNNGYMMIDKKEFLLDSIIKAYIEHLEPIGSGQLKVMYDLSYSPATIRGYFKKLGDEGYLAQEHASSGRTPTTEALKEYWSNRISVDIGLVDYDKLNILSKDIGITVFLKKQNKQILSRVTQIEDIYLLLEFSTFSIVIKYNSALSKFLNDMIGLDAYSILEVAKQVGANELYCELDSYIYDRDFQIINVKEFLKLCVQYDFDEITIKDFLHGNIMEKIKSGIYFQGSAYLNNVLPAEYLAISHDVQIDNEHYKMIVLGELSKDYEYFYKGITK
jgi:heat-inducible transcriptional repressor